MLYTKFKSFSISMSTVSYKDVKFIEINEKILYCFSNICNYRVISNVKVANQSSFLFCIILHVIKILFTKRLLNFKK